MPKCAKAPLALQGNGVRFDPYGAEKAVFPRPGGRFIQAAKGDLSQAGHVQAYRFPVDGEGSMVSFERYGQGIPLPLLKIRDCHALPVAGDDRELVLLPFVVETGT